MGSDGLETEKYPHAKEVIVLDILVIIQSLPIERLQYCVPKPQSTQQKHMNVLTSNNIMHINAPSH